VAAKIRTYTPQLPRAEWAVIEDFVRTAVTDCEERTPYAAANLLSVCSQHVRWCTQVAGQPLDRAVIFHREVIEEYICGGITRVTAGTRGNRRSLLLRMSELLLPPQARTVRLAALPPASPSTPYTPRELSLLRSWAGGQNTEFRRVNAHILLALGLGAGLAARELQETRPANITCDSDGVLITVAGARPRVVPVLGEWESVLRDVATAAMHKDSYLFRPRRTRCYPNAITGFVAETVGRQVPVSSQRMRATWIVGHLRAGVPVKALVDASGVASFEAFTRYLPFVPDLFVTDYRDAFRRELPTP